MITITKTEIEVKDIRDLAAAYRDVAEGYGNGCKPEIFYNAALSLLKLIDVESISTKDMSSRVENGTS